MDLPITIITVVSNLFLGLLTFLKNPKNVTHRLFGILSLILATWSVTNYFSLHSPDLDTTLFWIRVILSIVTPMWTVLLLLVLAFPHNRLKINRAFLFFLIPYTIITSIVALSPYMFTGITAEGENIQPIPGPGIILHALLALGSLGACTILLLRKFRRSFGREKLQLKFFLFGIITSFSLLILTNFVLVNVFKTSLFVVFGPFFTLILVGSISYAIVKHRFLDIRLVVARSVAYTLLIVVLGAMYAAGLFVVGAVFIGVSTTGGQLIASTILALAMAFSFQPLRRYLEKTTDKIFYKDHYDPQVLLGRLSHIMASTIVLEELTNELLNELFSQVKISRGSLLLVKDHKITWVKTHGFDAAPTFDESEIDKLVNYHKNSHANGEESIIVFEELEEGETKEILRRNNITLAIPLSVKGEKIGILLAGEKASGDLYSAQDLKVLEILAPEMAVAIQNAQSYEEIRRFSITLQEEVDRATKELRDANEKLKALDKLKDEFLSLATHELRTPMTAIKSYLWMIMNKAATLDEEKKRLYMDRVYNSTERLLKLVNELLDVSRIESGRLKLTPASMDLLGLAHEVADEFAARVGDRKQALTINDTSLPLVFADRDKIHEVLLNLIGNAIKYTPEGGKITVTFVQKDGMVETSVADTGRGISQEDMTKLFTKFGRLDNTLVAIGETGGSGLGLYICKQLVELSGGKIWVTSEVDKGSTFTFTLPVPSVVAQTAQAPQEPSIARST